MKVKVNKGTYEYFKDLLEDDGQRLIESWKEYIEADIDFIFWQELYAKVINEVSYSSAQMVAKLLRGEIEVQLESPTRFVYYKTYGRKRRYYGSAEEVDKGIKATWYDTGNSYDEGHMKALETLGWFKIPLDEAIEQDKSK